MFRKDFHALSRLLSRHVRVSLGNPKVRTVRSVTPYPSCGFISTTGSRVFIGYTYSQIPPKKVTIEKEPGSSVVKKTAYKYCDIYEHVGTTSNNMD